MLGTRRIALLPLATLVALAACASCGNRRGEASRGVDPPLAQSSPTPQPVASAAPVETNDPPPLPPDAEAATPKPQIACKWTLSYIFDKPDMQSTVIGWLRAGSRIARAAEATTKGTVPCGGTWYQVEPQGFVCDGQAGITSNLDDPSVAAAAQFPLDQDAPLPFGYGMSYGTPLYARVPTSAEQRGVEGDVGAHIKQVEEQRAKMPPEKVPPLTALPVGPMPSFLEGGAQAPVIVPWVTGKRPLTAGYAIPDNRLAFLSAFDVDGRVFYLTTEHLIVPADRFKAARLADFRGIELAKPEEPGAHLPLVWARLGEIPVYRLDLSAVDGGAAAVADAGRRLPADARALPLDTKMPKQAHAEVLADEIVIKGARYAELARPADLLGEAAQTGERYLVKTTDVARLDAAKELPPNVGAGDVWADVSVGKQTLVVYEGLVPIYTTLVSTGAGKGRMTPLGTFRVYAKHLSSRMSQEEKPAEKEGDEAEHAYRFDDVPYVQYLYEGIAFHAAFWHDSFGLAHSHGCINLSPRDAMWLFHRTLPQLPSGWHGVNAGRAGIALGTTVLIHY